MYLTKNELEIMDVMWEAARPLSRGELMELSVDKTWKDSSVHILLNSLMDKGALHEAGFARCGKTCGRTYAPSVSVEEYYASTLDSTKTRPEPGKLFDAYAKALNPSAEEISRCIEILENLK